MKSNFNIQFATQRLREEENSPIQSNWPPKDNEIKGNDNIIWKKEKVFKNPDGEIIVKYVPYYKGHIIDRGGYNFGNTQQLEKFIKDYILSNQQYNKYKFLLDLTNQSVKENSSNPADISKLNRYIVDLEGVIIGLGESKLRTKLLTLTSQLNSAAKASASDEVLEILAEINEIIENAGNAIDNISKRDIVNITQKINNHYSLEENSATPAEGAYLTKAGAKRQTPKATSGYKEVKGYRPGHSKLKIVEPKDLWNLNEAVATKDKENIKSILQLVKGDSELYDTFIGMMSEPYPHGYDEFYNMLPTDKQLQAPKPEELSQSDSTWSQKIKSFFGKKNEKLSEVGNKPESEDNLKYKTGEDIKVGDSVTTDEGDTGDVVGFQKASDDDEETIFVTLTKQENGSSTPVPNTPFFSHQLELNKSKSEPLKEGIKTEIKQRNKSQQFHEATKMVNKKLKEINNILEYAEQLKGELDESSRPNHLMEKMKREMVSAYNKMRKL